MLGMGDLAPVIKALMSGDKGALVNLAKPHLPDILKTVVQAVVQAAGGDPETDGAFLWLHAKRDGGLTIMATVYHRTTLDEPGETVATIDVLDMLDKLDLVQFLK